MLSFIYVKKTIRKYYDIKTLSNDFEAYHSKYFLQIWLFIYFVMYFVMIVLKGSLFYYSDNYN